MSNPHIVAAQPDISAWVGANAGSGKTYVLISRLVTLMLNGSPPERLLCLTYTRSAAAEMQSRLFDLLSEWALLDDIALEKQVFQRTGFVVNSSAELYKARTLFARALETPGGLRVQTIHAFCESLLHRFPLEAGLVPGFELLDDVRGNELIEGIVSSLMRAVGDPKLALGLDLLSRQLPTDDLISLAKRLIRERARYERPASEEGLNQHLTEMFGEITDEALAQAQSRLVQDLLSIEKVISKSAANSGSKKDLDLAQKVSTFKGTSSLEEQWIALKNIFLTDSGTLRKQLITKGFAASDASLADRLMDIQNTFFETEVMCRRANARALTDALYRLSDRLMQDYNAHKHRSNELDYDDLIDFSNHLLLSAQSAAWVMFKIDGGLDHILIDEAQDTSARQWQLINALAQEFFVGDSAREQIRTIFAVGDEKQSIFSFQGADPAAFDAMRQHFEKLVRESGSAFKRVPLIMSRRSTPEILQAVDAIFRPVAHRSGLTVSNNEILHEAYRARELGYVEVWPVISVDRQKSDDKPDLMPDTSSVQMPRVLLATKIAQKIRSLLDEPGSHIRPRDMLILVRQRNAFFAEMLRALNAHNIPIAGADRMSLLQEVAIKDLIIAGEVALMPENDLAVAILLRSPLVGMSEELLFDLAHKRAGSLVDAIYTAGALPAAMAEANKEIAEAIGLITWLGEAVNRLTPFDFYAQLLSGWRGQAKLKARLGPQIDDAISEFLRLALTYERNEPAALQGFLDWVQQNATEIKRDMDQASDAVRIMTVHGAKGLEAPIVFLPDNCQPPAQSSRQRVLISDYTLAWSSKATEKFESDTERQAARLNDDLEESRRLLYVALTRAKDRLYVGGYMGGAATTKSVPNPESWFGMIENSVPDGAKLGAIEADGTRQVVWSLGDETKAGPFPADDGIVNTPSLAPPDWLFRRGNAHATSGSQRSSYKILQPTSQPIAVTKFIDYGDVFEETTSTEADPLLKGMAAADLGNVVHRMLEHLPRAPRAEREMIAKNYLDLYAPNLNALGQAAQTASVIKIIEDPELAALFGPHARAERPIVGWLTTSNKKSVYLTGQIDRYVHNRAENWIWVADFKTGTPQHDNPLYCRQMAVYRYLLRAACGVEDIRCSLIWTQSGENVFYSDSELDRAITGIFDKLDR